MKIEDFFEQFQTMEERSAAVRALAHDPMFEVGASYDPGREYLDCEGIHRISYHTGDGWCVFELDTENHDMVLSFPSLELEYGDSDDDPTAGKEPINRCLQLEDTDQISIIRHYL